MSTSAWRVARALGLRIAALVILCRVEWTMRRFPIATACARLEVRLDSTVQTRPPAALNPSRRWTVKHRADVVNGLLPWWPGGDTCLRRCLVLAVLLRADAPVLHLGVRREPNGAIGAHSWLEIGGLSIDPTSASYRQFVA